MDIAKRLTFGAAQEGQPSVAVASGEAAGRLAFSSLAWNEDLWSLPTDTARGTVVGQMRQVTRNAARELYPSLSRDGKQLVFFSDRMGNWDVWRKDLESGREAAVTTNRFDEKWPLITPDGSKVAYVVTENQRAVTYVVGLRGGAAEKGWEDCVLQGWSSDGKRILYAVGARGRPRDLVLLDLASGRKTDWVRESGARLHGGSLSPDDRWIAYAAGAGSFAPVRRSLSRGRRTRGNRLDCRHGRIGPGRAAGVVTAREPPLFCFRA